MQLTREKNKENLLNITLLLIIRITLLLNKTSVLCLVYKKSVYLDHLGTKHIIRVVFIVYKKPII